MVRSLHKAIKCGTSSWSKLTGVINRKTSMCVQEPTLCRGVSMPYSLRVRPRYLLIAVHCSGLRNRDLKLYASAAASPWVLVTGSISTHRSHAPPPGTPLRESGPPPGRLDSQNPIYGYLDDICVEHYHLWSGLSTPMLVSCQLEIKFSLIENHIRARAVKYVSSLWGTHNCR